MEEGVRVRGLLVFTVERIDRPLSYDFMDALRRQENDHRMMYHMEHVRVLTGTAAQRFGDGSGDAWRLDTDAMGDVSDADSIARQVRQMVSRLYATVHDAHDDKCDLVFAGEGGACATTALTLARMVREELQKYFPRLFTHVMILQDQLTSYADAAVSHMTARIQACNPLRFYQTIYLLPWEEDKRRGTAETICALIKAMMMSEEDPMIRGPQDENWIETAALVKLEAPVNEITRIIFQYMTDDFIGKVILPLAERQSPPEGVKGVEERIRGIKERVEAIARAHRLPPLEAFFEIMPRQDPPLLLGEKDDPPVGDAAWCAVEQMYGAAQADQFKKWLNQAGDRNQIQEQYREMEEEVTLSLLREAFSMAGDGVMDLAQVRNCVSAIGCRLGEMCGRISLSDSVDLTFRRPAFFSSRDVKDAVRIARTRETILQSVYKEAHGRLASLHREMRGRAIERAADNASQYVGDCLAILASRFSQERDIRLSQMPTGHHFDSRLRDIYTQWCKDHAGDLKQVTATALCACFTPDVLRSAPNDAVSAVIGRLMDMFIRYANEAVDSLRVHISQFFKEIDFRTRHLETIGASDDLVQQLRDHMMQDRSGAIPILLDTEGERIMRAPAARAFVFHRPGCDSARRFGELISSEPERNTAIISDPCETGVQMVVKYAGSALNHTLFYINNAK